MNFPDPATSLLLCGSSSHARARVYSTPTRAHSACAVFVSPFLCFCIPDQLLCRARMQLFAGWRAKRAGPSSAPEYVFVVRHLPAEPVKAAALHWSDLVIPSRTYCKNHTGRGHKFSSSRGLNPVPLSTGRLRP